MLLSMIVACAENWVIGRDNNIPWHLPDDFKHFKRTTLGKPIIMGRKTWEALPKKPLKKRLNIVMTRHPDYEASGAVVVNSAEAALAAAGNAEEAVVIGGGVIYRMFLPQAQRLYLTRVHTTIDGDVTFPEIDLAEWKVVEQVSHSADERHQYAFDILTLDRL